MIKEGRYIVNFTNTDYHYNVGNERYNQFRTEAANSALVKQARQQRNGYSLRSRLGLKLMSLGLALTGRLERATASQLLTEIQSRSLEQPQTI